MTSAELKTAKKVIGAKQSLKALEKGLAVLVYLATDADARVIEPVREMCVAHNVAVDITLSMADLGTACGIRVGAAAVTCLKD